MIQWLLADRGLPAGGYHSINKNVGWGYCFAGRTGEYTRGKAEIPRAAERTRGVRLNQKLTGPAVVKRECG